MKNIKIIFGSVFKNNCAITIIILLIIFFSVTNAKASIIYVNLNATGLNNGTSWANAFVSFQSALDNAIYGDEIWVAKGTYKPEKKAGGSTERHKTFQINNGVGIYGGFVGNENLLDSRDWQLNETILSGDIGIIGDSLDNCYHVISYPYNIIMDTTTIIDGFTIKNGNANSLHPDNNGGAMIMNLNGTPVICNCVFINNISSNSGGAISIHQSSPIFKYCIFDRNISNYQGGSIYLYFSNKSIIKGCII